MGQKTVEFTPDGIEKLPNNKPVVYKIKTGSGKINYAGKAKRGRVKARIGEQLGKVPGTSVSIEQFPSIKEAGKKEARVIKRKQPKYNKRGK